MNCPADWIEAAAADRLSDADTQSLTEHLSGCPKCCGHLDAITAGRHWWQEAARFLDESVLSDPDGDAADTSACDARLFDDDDAVGQLKSLGAIEPASHPEMLGRLGRYTVERELGTGGMGVVMKAHDAELNRIVAIKVLAPHLARSGAARQRFVREGRAAAAVVHDNVVAIHEVDTSAALPYLVMRYVDGISLQRHVDLYGPLSIFDTLRIASQTAAGLAAAHRQGIIHRDVKPANILVNHSCSRTWISDFGLARAVDDASLTRTGFIAGTPHYMSPEQARGGDVGPHSDLFSLGAVMYFMFTGRPPWRADRSLAVLHRIVSQPHRPLWKLQGEIPRRVSDLVDRLLCKEVCDRPESAAAVQAELEHVLVELQNPESQPSREWTGSGTKVIPRWWSRPWFVVPTTALATAAVMLVAQNFPSRSRLHRTETVSNEPSAYEIVQSQRAAVSERQDAAAVTQSGAWSKASSDSADAPYQKADRTASVQATPPSSSFQVPAPLQANEWRTGNQPPSGMKLPTTDPLAAAAADRGRELPLPAIKTGAESTFAEIQALEWLLNTMEQGDRMEWTVQ